MEFEKLSRRPMNHSTSEAKGRAETDLLFADELEIQCVAKRGAVVPSKVARAPAVEQFQQIELIPILPIDEENARQFPVETDLLATAPLRVVPAKQPTTAPVAGKLNRSTPRIARPQRRWLVRIGTLSVIAGFAIGWVAGRPLSYSVSQVRANVVLPAPVGESPLGTSGLQRDTEKPAPPASRADDSVTTVPPAPASAANSIAREEADVVKPPAVLTPSPLPSRPEAVPAPARVDTAATAPAPVPLREMPVVPAPREPAVEKPVTPPTSPAVEAPVAMSPATRPSVPERTASPVEAVNETAAVRAALTKYANAYTDLDAAAVTAVWPSVDQAGLRRAFSALDAQQVTFDRCDVQVTGAAGRATCVGTTMWRPKIGGGSAREQNRTWNFALKNAGGSWQIVKAEVR